MSVPTTEEILAVIENASPDYEAQFSLASHLKSHGSPAAFSNLIPAAQEPAGQEKRDPLDMLSMVDGKHTLGYLYFLSARLAASNAQAVKDEHVASFVELFNPELAELAPERMVLLARMIWKRAESSHQHNLAVLPLRTILEKYPPPSPEGERESRLTPIHSVFLQACFGASSPSEALPLLRRPLTSVHVPSTSSHEPSTSTALASIKSEDSSFHLTYLDYLTYTYFAGVLLGMLKLWQEAGSYFEMCATAPTHGVAISALQLEAAKKLILVQLIAYGKVRPLPPYAAPSLHRMLKQQSPYLSLPKSYPSCPKNFPSSNDLKIFAQDNNTGLLNIALEKSVRWRIIEMMGTYEVLPLSDVCRYVGLIGDGARRKGRQVLQSMIEEGEIRATIEIENGEEIVSFNHSLDLSLGSSSVKTNILSLVAKTQREAKRLEKMERELLLSKDFIYKALKPSQSDMYDDPEMGMGATGWDDLGL